MTEDRQMKRPPEGGAALKEWNGIPYHYDNDLGQRIIGGPYEPGALTVGCFYSPEGEPLVTLGNQPIGTVAEVRDTFDYYLNSYFSGLANALATSEAASARLS